MTTDGTLGTSVSIFVAVSNQSQGKRHKPFFALKTTLNCIQLGYDLLVAHHWPIINNNY